MRKPYPLSLLASGYSDSLNKRTRATVEDFEVEIVSLVLQNGHKVEAIRGHVGIVKNSRFMGAEYDEVVGIEMGLVGHGRPLYTVLRGCKEVR